MSAAAQEVFENAIALQGRGDVVTALSYFRKALELAPQDTEIAYGTASAMLQAGQLDEAQSQLRRIVFAEPGHLKARTSLANCQLLIEDFENAKTNFSEVLAQTPDNKNALYGLASVLLKENNPIEASVPATILRDKMPENAAVLTLFAETQAKTGQIAAAVAAYRKALKADTQHVPAMLGLAQTLLLRKQFSDVIDLTVKAAQLSPADPLPLEMLSLALEGLGELQDAREAGQEAVRLAPNSSHLQTRMSVLSRKLEENAAAIKYALQAHDCDPDQLEPLKALGAALAAHKFPKEARTVLTDLSSSRSLDPEIREVAETLAKTAVVSASIEPKPSVQSASKPAVNQADEKAPVVAARSSDIASRNEPIPNVLGLNRQDKS
ncbi:MAG: tetratricopeptide repeat protein [Roseibium sp.]